MKRLLLALLIVGGWACVADADPYFNSSEPGCVVVGGLPTNSNYLLCDDLDDGRLYLSYPSTTDPLDNGWQPGSCDDCVQANYVVCGGAGVGGSLCAAQAILISNSDGGGPGRMPLTHGLFGNPQLPAIRGRIYFKFLPGYIFNGNQKFISGQRASNQGGIDLYSIGHDLNVMRMLPSEDTRQNDLFNYFNPQNNVHSPYLGHNVSDINLTTGTWYYMEYRIVLNTNGVQDGIFQQWINDCGPTGNACGAAPILRSSYTNIRYRGVGQSPYPDSSQYMIGGYYQDIWGNPSDGGTLLWDNLVIAKDANGLIGFVGASANPPPGIPSGVRVCKGTNCIP